MQAPQQLRCWPTVCARQRKSVTLAYARLGDGWAIGSQSFLATWRRGECPRNLRLLYDGFQLRRGCRDGGRCFPANRRRSVELGLESDALLANHRHGRSRGVVGWHHGDYRLRGISFGGVGWLRRTQHVVRGALTGLFPYIGAGGGDDEK